MHKLSEDELVANAQTLARCISCISSHGFVRQSLLLRLVTAGMPLNAAAALRACEIADGFDYGKELDPYCRQYGMHDLVTDAQVYCRTSLGNDDSATHLDYPLFPSRKGGRPITARSAERLLKAAWNGIAARTNITFRTAAQLGRRLRRIQDRHSCECRRDLTAILPMVRSQASLAFPRNSHDREDAEQSVLLHVLEHTQNEVVSRDAAEELTQEALRRFRREHNVVRRTEVSGILGDWATVVNRSDAKLRTSVYESEVESSLDSREASSRLTALIAALPKRDQQVIKLRTGLGVLNNRARSRAEVAAKFSVTPERIRQIEARSIRKLQKPVNAAEVVGFLD